MRLPAPNLAGHKNAYARPGVLDGNFAEDLLASDAHGRPGFVLDRGGAFDGTSTAQATFTPEGKSGAELAAAARREDIVLKYVKYGATGRGGPKLGQLRAAEGALPKQRFAALRPS
ncbi:hypothetical protein ABPG77_006714 [Micractinium sp. CCAP 211/92]